jgi:hypothetical protein
MYTVAMSARAAGAPLAAALDLATAALGAAAGVGVEAVEHEISRMGNDDAAATRSQLMFILFSLMTPDTGCRN